MIVAPFNDELVPTGFDYLLDGEGQVNLGWNAIFALPETIIMNVTNPSAEIFSARLIIEATPIPEPSTALLVATGLLMLSKRRYGV